MIHTIVISVIIITLFVMLIVWLVFQKLEIDRQKIQIQKLKSDRRSLTYKLEDLQRESNIL